MLVQTITSKSAKVSTSNKLHAVDIGNKVLGRYTVTVEHKGQINSAVMVGIADRLNSALYGLEPAPEPEPEPDQG